MPIYEYVCPDCQFKFELMRSFSQSTEAASCPHCHKNAKRILSKFACFSTDASGATTSVGGNPCAGCSTQMCDTCGL